MLRWMSGHTRLDKVRNESIREKVGVVPIEDKLREERLRCFGHMKRRHTEAPVRQVEHIRLEDRKKKRAITLRSGKVINDEKSENSEKRENEKETDESEKQESAEKSKLDKQFGKFLEVLKKLYINVPFVDALSQMPSYAKFLKEILSNKRKLEDDETVVRELIFPADFYILDMEDTVPASKSALILFERPFLKTAKTKIDVDDGTLTVEFDGETDVFELSMDDELEVVISQGIQEISTNQPLIVEVQDAVMALQSLPTVPKRYRVSKIDLPVSHTKLLPSVVQTPVLKLKPLPEHLKYVYLGDSETLLVIISNNLTKIQEDRLIRVLRVHKEAIGWTIADIKGISPSVCMHRILLEDYAKPSREAQRRLKP
ncbi:hypothetical protein P3X46_017085 [Hevea brasiliensis]|uniref:Uncharacterized protein n=1 Tax=Hevea brasiliensis TaxID=3981 RepID=A0ABQ9M4R1_HEVBR|nr:hypothetical protein P3X46_017085 [Hevea brasiliensis]